jgi:hypothetical protein
VIFVTYNGFLALKVGGKKPVKVGKVCRKVVKVGKSLEVFKTQGPKI